MRTVVLTTKLKFYDSLHFTFMVEGLFVGYPKWHVFYVNSGFPVLGTVKHLVTCNKVFDNDLTQPIHEFKSDAPLLGALLTPPSSSLNSR